MADAAEVKAEVKASVIKFVDEAKRTKIIPFGWPVTVDGVLYSECVIRRLSGAEVQAYVEKVTGGDASADNPMMSIPMAVYEALDDDDRLAIDEAAALFLPRRLRMVQEPTPANGEPTSPSSPTS